MIINNIFQSSTRHIFLIIPPIYTCNTFFRIYSSPGIHSRRYMSNSSWNEENQYFAIFSQHKKACTLLIFSQFPQIIPLFICTWNKEAIHQAVLHRNNREETRARQKALKKTQGKWLFFFFYKSSTCTLGTSGTFVALTPLVKNFDFSTKNKQKVFEIVRNAKKIDFYVDEKCRKSDYLPTLVPYFSIKVTLQSGRVFCT